jgi:hypothetical protein
VKEVALSRVPPHAQGHGHAYGRGRVERDLPEAPAREPVIVERGRSEADAETYSLRAEAARLKVNLHVGTMIGSAPGGTFILEKDASVKINAHIGTLIAGEGGGELVVGEGASLHLNLHADVATTGGRLVVPDGVSMKIDVHARGGAPPPAGALPGARAAIHEVPAAISAVELAPEKAAASLPPDERRPARPARDEDAERDDPLKDALGVRWWLMREILDATEKQRLKAHEHVLAARGGHGKEHGRGGGSRE